MTAIGDIRETLGRLGAETDAIREDVRELKAASDDRGEMIARIPVIEEHVASLRKDIDDKLQPLVTMVAEHERLRQRTVGIMAGVGLGGGALGAFADKLIGWFSGGGGS